MGLPLVHLGASTPTYVKVNYGALSALWDIFNPLTDFGRHLKMLSTFRVWKAPLLYAVSYYTANPGIVSIDVHFPLHPINLDQ